ILRPRVGAFREPRAFLFALEDENIVSTPELGEAVLDAAPRPPERVDDDPALGMAFSGLHRQTANVHDLHSETIVFFARSAIPVVFGTAHGRASQEREAQGQSRRIEVSSDLIANNSGKISRRCNSTRWRRSRSNS